MSAPAAIQATFSTYKPVPTRSVLQLVFEVPIERQADVFAALGYPLPGEERMVAVALLKESKPVPNVVPLPAGETKPRRRLADMPLSQRAALLCGDVAFRRYFGQPDEASAAQELRERCGVASRAELDHKPFAAEAFRRLVAEYEQSTGRMAERRGS